MFNRLKFSLPFQVIYFLLEDISNDRNDVRDFLILEEDESSLDFLVLLHRASRRKAKLRKEIFPGRMKPFEIVRNHPVFVSILVYSIHSLHWYLELLVPSIPDRNISSVIVHNPV